MQYSSNGADPRAAGEPEIPAGNPMESPPPDIPPEIPPGRPQENPPAAPPEMPPPGAPPETPPEPAPEMRLRPRRVLVPCIGRLHRVAGSARRVPVPVTMICASRWQTRLKSWPVSRTASVSWCDERATRPIRPPPAQCPGASLGMASSP